LQKNEKKMLTKVETRGILSKLTAGKTEKSGAGSANIADSEKRTWKKGKKSS